MTRSTIVAGVSAVILVASACYLAERIILPFAACERLMIR